MVKSDPVFPPAESDLRTQNTEQRKEWTNSSGWSDVFLAPSLAKLDFD
jgi:hypothetical protein